MTLTRQMTFWVLTLLVGVVALWVLREILLPFVAGMALAYLLDPLANRLERLGVNRLVASLVIIGAFVLAFVILLLLLRAGADRRSSAPSSRSCPATSRGCRRSRWIRTANGCARSSARASPTRRSATS